MGQLWESLIGKLNAMVGCTGTTGCAFTPTTELMEQYRCHFNKKMNPVSMQSPASRRHAWKRPGTSLLRCFR